MLFSEIGPMTSPDRPKIFCVTSARGLGCTFLDWSVYWLSGQDHVYDLRAKQWLAITEDPLKTTGAVSNAHNHAKNHPSGSMATKDAVRALLSADHSERRTSFYPFPLHLDLALEQIGRSAHDLQDAKVRHDASQLRQDDYLDTLAWIHTQQIPVIYVAIDPLVAGYFWQPRSLERGLVKPSRPNSLDDVWQEYDDIFFKRSTETWDAMGLTDVWDQRERMALNMRPFAKIPMSDLTLPFKHQWINCQDLWFDTERTISRAMSWLDLEITTTRLDHWRSVAQRWQATHNDHLRFYRQLPQIVRAIVRGHDFEIPPLTLRQEATVLHCLLYQHDLNLKSWQLCRFPNNARDLHALLEANIHPLDHTV